LLGGARTDLSGLTSAEARALFLVAGPSSTATPDVKAALRKLVRALPETFRSDAEAASVAVVTDPNAWGSTTPARPTPRHLDLVQRLVVEGEQAVLQYVDRERKTSERVVHPLGLATKGQVWYLVADTASGLRTFRIDRIGDVTGTGDRVVRPPGFVLADAWKLIADEVDKRRSPVWARGVAATEVMWQLRGRLGNRVQIGAATVDGMVEVEMRGATVRALAGEIAGYGNLLQIHDPPELVAELATVGRELVALYAAATVTG
jgi:predicted DNA-binding transcriptional regulator YafY